MLAVDLDRRKAGRQGAGSHDVFRPDGFAPIVEIGEVAGANIDRPDAQPDVLGVDPVEIDQPLQRGLQGHGVIDAERFGGAGRIEDRGRNSGGEEARRAEQRRAQRIGLIDPGAHLTVAKQGVGLGSVGDQSPEFRKFGDALARRIADDERRVDRTDRDARDPVRTLVDLAQRLVDPRLI